MTPPSPLSIERDLLRRALLGELTRRNTRPGTPERQAVNRTEYLRRRELHPRESARQATGHRSAGSSSMASMSILVADPPRFLVVGGLSRRDRSRAGRYGDLVGKLDTGRLSAAEFRRRVRRWRPIEGLRFLSDPDAVLAILDSLRAQDREVFVYDRGSAA